MDVSVSSADSLAEGDGENCDLDQSSILIPNSDKDNTNAPQDEDFPRVPVSTPVEENGDDGESYITGIMDQITELYKARLNINKIKAKQQSNGKPPIASADEEVFQKWIKDLQEQNATLVKTIGEMKLEAELRSEKLERKISEQTELAQVQMTMLHEYETQFQRSLKERDFTEQRHLVMMKDMAVLEREKSILESKLEQSERECENLLTLVMRIRDTGVWDTSGLNFDQRTYDEIFGPYPNLPGNEVQTVFSQEKLKKMNEVEEKASKLKEHVQDMERERDDNLKTVTLKNNEVMELQMKVKNLEEKVEFAEGDKKVLMDSLKDAHLELKCRSHTESRVNEQLSERELEATVLRDEVTNLRSQINIISKEREAAVDDVKAHQRQLDYRVQEMAEIKNLIQKMKENSAQSDPNSQQVLTFKNYETQLNQDLHSMKDQVQEYEVKFEAAQALIRDKTETIQQLENSMQGLQEQVQGLKNFNQDNSIQGSEKKRTERDRILRGARSSSRSIVKEREKPPWNEFFGNKKNLSNINVQNGTQIQKSQRFQELSTPNHGCVFNRLCPSYVTPEDIYVSRQAYQYEKSLVVDDKFRNHEKAQWRSQSQRFQGKSDEEGETCSLLTEKISNYFLRNRHASAIVIPNPLKCDGPLKFPQLVPESKNKTNRNARRCSPENRNSKHREVNDEGPQPKLGEKQQPKLMPHRKYSLLANDDETVRRREVTLDTLMKVAMKGAELLSKHKLDNENISHKKGEFVISATQTHRKHSKRHSKDAVSPLFSNMAFEVDFDEDGEVIVKTRNSQHVKKGRVSARSLDEGEIRKNEDKKSTQGSNENNNKEEEQDDFPEKGSSKHDLILKALPKASQDEIVHKWIKTHEKEPRNISNLPLSRRLMGRKKVNSKKGSSSEEEPRLITFKAYRDEILSKFEKSNPEKCTKEKRDADGGGDETKRDKNISTFNLNNNEEFKLNIEFGDPVLNGLRHDSNISKEFNNRNDEKFEAIIMFMDKLKTMQGSSQQLLEEKKKIAAEISSKDAEITMQKLTITHLQEALVALKKGVSSNPSSHVPCGKVFHI